MMKKKKKQKQRQHKHLNNQNTLILKPCLIFGCFLVWGFFCFFRRQNKKNPENKKTVTPPPKKRTFFFIFQCLALFLPIYFHSPVPLSLCFFFFSLSLSIYLFSALLLSSFLIVLYSSFPSLFFCCLFLCISWKEQTQISTFRRFSEHPFLLVGFLCWFCVHNKEEDVEVEVEEKKKTTPAEEDDASRRRTRQQHQMSTRWRRTQRSDWFEKRRRKNSKRDGEAAENKQIND